MLQILSCVLDFPEPCQGNVNNLVCVSAKPAHCGNDFVCTSERRAKWPLGLRSMIEMADGTIVNANRTRGKYMRFQIEETTRSKADRKSVRKSVVP